MREVNFEDLESIFNHIRENFEPTGEDGLTPEENERQRQVRELMAESPTETSMISTQLRGWFQEKIDILKESLTSRFFEISPTGDQWEIIADCRNKIVERLQRLLEDMDVNEDMDFNYDNLLDSTPEGVQARNTFCKKISKKIARTGGDEKERYIEAFELITALQGLSLNDPVYGTYANPFLPNSRDIFGNIIDNSSVEWLTYIYLATQFFEPEDIEPQIEAESKEDLQNKVFQFFVRTISDIIRGHNIDHWPDDPYHPKNRPSCILGAEGRIILGSVWHKELVLLNAPEPIFSHPRNVLEAAVISQMLRNLTAESSRELLQVLDDIADAMEGPYPLRKFFTFSEEEKDALIANIVSELLAEWARDLSGEDKKRVITAYTDSVTDLLKTQLNELLENKFTSERLPPHNTEYGFNESTINRFKTGVFKKLFGPVEVVKKKVDRGDSGAIVDLLIEFRHTPGIMTFFLKEYGHISTIFALMNLSLKVYASEIEEVDYLRLLVDLTVAISDEAIGHLIFTEQSFFQKILKIDLDQKLSTINVRGKEILSKEGKETQALITISKGLLNMPWEKLIEVFRGVFEPDWRAELLKNPSLVNHLFNRSLTDRNYINFEAILQSLSEEETTAPCFIDKASLEIQTTLSSELALDRVYLLKYLLSVEHHRDEVLSFLGGLNPAQVQALLDSGELLRYAGLLESIINKLPISSGNRVHAVGYVSDLGLAEARQIAILNHLSTSAKIVGEGSLSYIKYLKNHEITPPFSEEVKGKANECWEQLYTKAINEGNHQVCRGYLKLGDDSQLETHLRNLYVQYMAAEDEDAKANLKAEINTWLSIFTHAAVPTNWPWIQDLYNQAYGSEDWEFCRLFLPIFNRAPDYYHLMPGTDHLLTLSQKKALCINTLSEIFLRGENDKQLLMAILNKDLGMGGTFMDNRRTDNDAKLKVLSNLVVYFKGFNSKEANPEVEALFEFTKKELEKLVEPLLDNVLSQDVTSTKHLMASEIIGDLLKNLGAYFDKMPEDPEEAFTAYQGILEAAQREVATKFGEASEFELASFLLNALFVLLTGGLALIAILINKANHKPAFFSSSPETPKAHLKDMLNKLTTAAAANGFFSTRREEEDTSVSEEKKLGEPIEPTSAELKIT